MWKVGGRLYHPPLERDQQRRISQLRLLSYLWSSRASGMLTCTVGSDGWVAAIQDGEPVFLEDIPHIERALLRGSVRFDEVPVDLAPLRNHLGPLLYRVALRSPDLNAHLSPSLLAHTTPLALSRLESVGCSPELLASFQGVDPQRLAAVLAHISQTWTLAEERAALELLGWSYSPAAIEPLDMPTPANLPADLPESLLSFLDIDDDPQAPLVEDAILATCAGNWQQARQQLQEALTLRMDAPKVLAWMAWVELHQTGSDHVRCDAAQRWLQTAAALDPECPEVRLLLARSKGACRRCTFKRGCTPSSEGIS